MSQSIKRRLKALECAANQKHNPPKLEVTRPGAGWVYLFWGNLLVKVLGESLWDAI